MEGSATTTRADGRQIERDAIDVIVLRDARTCAKHVHHSSHAPRVVGVANPA